MTLTNTQKAGIAALSLIIAFAAGRYSNNIKPSKTTIDTDKQTDNKDESKQTHTVTTVVTVKEPNGETKTTKTTDTTIADKIEDQKQDNKTDQQIITQPESKKLNISALASPGFESGLKMSYGASISKEVLGPITVGAFGLTNGTVGVSIGLDF